MADPNAVPEPVEKAVSPNAALKLELKFRGVAKYVAYLCTPGPSGEWVVSRTLESNGSSEDAWLDSFEFNGPGKGEQCNVWVVANFKETDIERIRPGQNVEIRVDTFKGRKFRGTVDSIMAGTGSAFALFPPENASGNYVKVVQRVPVKIVLPRGEDPGRILRIGMSVVPTILVR